MNTWNFWLKSGAAAAVLLSGSLFMSAAQAGIVDCHADTLPLVTNTVDCEKSSETQDFLTDPMTVNTEAFFGFSDWEYLDKTDYADDQGQSGTWAVDPSIWDDFTELLLIFKDGAGTTLLGFLADDGATGGTWQSPFREPEFDMNPDRKIKDVSHITHYVRGTVVDIPESSAFFLMLMGLVGLVVARKRTLN